MDSIKSKDNCGMNGNTGGYPRFELVPVGSGILTRDLLTKAEKELNETEEKVKEGILQMRDLVRKFRLRCNTDNEFLLRFLRGKKHDLKASFEMLKHYLHGLSVINNKFGLPQSDVILKILKTRICGILPYRDSEGRAIIYYRTSLLLQAGFTIAEVILAVMIKVYFLIQDPATQVAGVTVIVNMEHFSFRELYVIEYLKTVIILMRGFTGRIKRIDVVNECFNAKLLVSLLQPFLPRKLRQRIVFHGDNLESLYKHYDKCILPEEYGGALPRFNNEHWIHKAEPLIQQLTKEIQFCINPHENSTLPERNEKVQ